MKNRRDANHNHLPVAVICAATEGEPDAVNTILRHYRGYITTLSLRRLHDEYGNTFLCVDETLRSRLEIKLITGLLAFDAA